MDILIKKATIVDPTSSFHLKVKDLLISKGKIQKIASKINGVNAKIIESNDLHVSIGWMDIGTQIGEPGYEYRETTKSLCDAASSGGYTALAPFPTSSPIIQAASDVNYLRSLFAGKLQDVYPIAALSKDKKGEDFIEIRDLISQGVNAFSDGLESIKSSGLLLRSLQYMKGTDALVIDFAFDEELSHGGQMHEGEQSIKMGLPGIPEMVETIPMNRNIEIAQYCESGLLLYALSSKKAVNLLKEAKKTNPKLKSTVSYLNLIATDSDLKGFNAEYKVLPPIRDKKDQIALLKGVKEGVIDAIVTNHCPLEEEKKKLEFPYAAPGATGLETCFSVLCTKLGKEDVLSLIPNMSVSPRQLFSIPIPSIKEENKAELTLFDPSIEWEYISSKSISKNNPFLGQELKGKVIGVINGSKSLFNL